MQSTTPTIQSTSLYSREGNSDKEYHAAIEPKGEGYIVTFAYGRRGNTHMLLSIVAWDHVSWPGNDFFGGSRCTDDGVKAAATDFLNSTTPASASQRIQDARGSISWRG